MSEEQLKAFTKKVKSDTELQDKCEEAASYEEAMDIAKSAGFSITEDDIQSMQSVSDEELEGAAGGREFCGGSISVMLRCPSQGLGCGVIR